MLPRKLIHRLAEGLNVLVQYRVHKEDFPLRERLQCGKQDAHNRRVARSKEHQRALMLLRHIEKELTTGRRDLKRVTGFDGIMQLLLSLSLRLTSRSLKPSHPPSFFEFSP